MANSVGLPPNDDGRLDDVRSHKRKIRVISLSGTYPTGGEILTARQFGLKRLIGLNVLSGTASETDLTGSWIARVNVNSTGQSVAIVLFEAAAAGGVFTEKPNEAYESAASLTVEAIGY
jgi:hypothetical protein